MLIAALPRLRASAIFLTRSPAAADDLLQEVAYRAWRAQTQFAPGTNFTGWMYRILRNEFISSQRKGKRTPVCIDEIPEQFFSRPGDQEDRLLTREVVRLLDKLNPSQREALMLICANGLSYGEASEAIGCSIGTVKSRLWRARQHMQLLMMGKESETTAGQPDGTNLSPLKTALS
jgi:RNA polymerase sigma-70 factor, ECF subfamily